jgi:hypothetical protein
VVETLKRKYPTFYTIVNDDDEASSNGNHNSQLTDSIVSDDSKSSFDSVNNLSAQHQHYAITINGTGDTYRTREYSHAPLELASLLVQEDLCLMRERDCTSAEEAEFEGKKVHVLEAASVCFSFVMPSKFNRPMGVIHVPVQGFRQHLQKHTNAVFSSLRSRVLWRSNWSVRSHGELIKSDVVIRLKEFSLPHSFNVGDVVEVNVNLKGVWYRGVIVELSDGRSYLVSLDDGRTLERVEEHWLSVPDVMKFSEGDLVIGNWKQRGTWYSGRVAQVHKLIFQKIFPQMSIIANSPIFPRACQLCP